MMKRDSDSPDGSAVKDRPAVTEPALEELRRLIRRSGLSQRRIELSVGFSKGYLSQLLARNLDLKVWHVLAVLEVLDQSPGEFFERVYPWRRRRALEKFRRSSRPLSEETDELLGQLYRHGVESLDELRARLESCERALAAMAPRRPSERKKGRGSS